MLHILQPLRNYDRSNDNLMVHIQGTHPFLILLPLCLLPKSLATLDGQFLVPHMQLLKVVLHCLQFRAFKKPLAKNSTSAKISNSLLKVSSVIITNQNHLSKKINKCTISAK